MRQRAFYNMNRHEFSSQNLHILITLAVNQELSHKTLMDWCSLYIHETDEGDNQNLLLNDKAIDIDAQWELFLSNTFTLSELQTLNLDLIKIPVQWLKDWLEKL